MAIRDIARAALALSVMFIMRTATADQTYLATKDRIGLLETSTKYCMGKFASNYETAANTLRATSGGSFSRICECAAILTVSKMSDKEISDDLIDPVASINSFNQEISSNMAKCVQLQP